MNLSRCSFFKARNGAMIVMGSIANPLLYSPNGNTFYVLHRLGWGNRKVSFENPHTGEQGELELVGDDVFYNNKQFMPVRPIQIPDAKIVPIPQARVPVYLFSRQTDDGPTFIYVSKDRYKDGLEETWVFVGPAQSMQRIGIEKTTNYVTGTFKVKTPLGLLIIPPNEAPSLDGDFYIRLNTDHVSIQENSIEASIQ